MSPHRRQFIIGPKPVHVRPDWVTTSLGDSHGLHLSHCPDLPVTSGDGDGSSTFLLLGDAQPTSPDGPTPAEVVQTSRSADEVIAASRRWFGRWVLVLDGTVHLDPCALLGCLYRRTNDGTVWVSSSSALLLREDVSDEPYTRAPRVTWEVAWDFYPAPYTAFSCLRRLMPSQVLDLHRGGAITARPLPGPACYDGPRDPESILDLLEGLLVGGVQAAERAHGSVAVPLTAGVDSRMLLAAASAAGCTDPLTFTQEYPWPQLAAADRELPPRLARAVGFRHELMPRKRLCPERLAAFDLHSGTALRMRDREFWAAGQWDAVPADAAVIRGSAFEITVGLFWRDSPVPRIPKLLPDTTRIADAIRQAWPFEHVHRGSAPHWQGLDEWEDWVHASPNEGLDWRDRTYLEQRVGAWAADIEQGLDITGRHRLPAANCHLLLSAGLSLPLEWRFGGAWQKELMRRMAPQVLDVPFNPGDGVLQRAVQRVHWERNMLRAAGRKPAYVATRTRQVVRRLTDDTRRPEPMARPGASPRFQSKLHQPERSAATPPSQQSRES